METALLYRREGVLSRQNCGRQAKKCIPVAGNGRAAGLSRPDLEHVGKGETFPTNHRLKCESCPPLHHALSNASGTGHPGWFASGACITPGC